MHLSDRKHDQYMKMKRQALSSVTPQTLKSKQFSQTQQNFNKITSTDCYQIDDSNKVFDYQILDNLQTQWNLQKSLIKSKVQEGLHQRYQQLKRQQEQLKSTKKLYGQTSSQKRPQSVKYDNVSYAKKTLLETADEARAQNNISQNYFKTQPMNSKTHEQQQNMYSKILYPENFLGEQQNAQLIDLQQKKKKFEQIISTEFKQKLFKSQQMKLQIQTNEEKQESNIQQSTEQETTKDNIKEVSQTWKISKQISIKNSDYESKKSVVVDQEKMLQQIEKEINIPPNKFQTIFSSRRSSMVVEGGAPSESFESTNLNCEVPSQELKISFIISQDKRPKNKNDEYKFRKQQLEKLIVQHIREQRQGDRENDSRLKEMLKLSQNPQDQILFINITTGLMDLDVIKKIVEKNKWKYAYGLDGDILWTICRTITQQMALVFQKLKISRIPSMRQMANKKTTSFYLNKFQEYFPKHYDFYPRTYTMPEEFLEFHKVYQETRSSKVFIAKPDKGTQGLGIFIVKEISQLFMNENIDMRYIKKGLVIQEYIQNPLLVDRKKFDLRLYVLVTSVNPLVVYINEEGLARFCTEEYQEATQQNSQNSYMHLTNYSVNKNNSKFIHQPVDFMSINDATKRTYTSVKQNLKNMNINIPKLTKKIEQVIIKFIYAMNPFLVSDYLQFQQFSMRDIYQDKWREAKNFHILGFDILIDQNLQPWILEVNANPSLDITQEILKEDGSKQIQTSELDYYVKTKVIEDAFLLSIKETSEQLKLIKLGQYFNSYKLLVDGRPPIENIDLFEKALRIFAHLCGHKFGSLNSSKFSRLAMVQKLLNDSCMKSDYDLIFKKIVMKSQVPEMNFIMFIDAIECVAQKLLQRKSKNYSKQKAVIWVVESALEHIDSLPQNQNQSLQNILN